MAATYRPRSAPTYTSPADLIEHLGALIAEQYALAEAIMIERVRRALLDELEDGAGVFAMQARAAVISDLRTQGEQIALGLTDELADRVVAIAAQEGRSAAASILTQVGLPTTSAISPTAAAAVASIALDLTSDLDKMTHRIVRWMPDVYQRTVGLLSPQVINGVATIQQAQRATAARLLSQGVTFYPGSDGRAWRIGTYAEMATRTAVNRAWIDAHGERMQAAAGLNLCSIVGGVGSCSKCAPHIGKVYSLDGTPAGEYQLEHAIESGRIITVTVAGTLDQARAAGWGHPNCRCTIAGYLAGLSIAAGTTYNPKAERDRDQQRYLERGVRDWKRRQAAALDDTERARAGRKVREWQARIRQHSAETGQIRRRYREQLGFSDGAAPAVPRLRPAAIAAP